ncbi:MAG: nucleotidyltransferase domain-containing protein [Lachnospiraceae bacterium]|nr:nucleotidyltransferase domain-containing protein [Lachnospiraceae bacterium]
MRIGKGAVIVSDKIYSLEELADVLSPIIRKYQAQKAILFGSYARNEADQNSDIDVMIVGGSFFDPTDIFCIADELNRAVNKNVDVYEENEIDHDSSFFNNIIKEGIEIA